MPQKSKLLKTLLVTSLTSGVSLTLPMVEIYAAVSKMTGDANIGTTYSDGLHPAFNNVQHFEDSNDIAVNQSSTLNILNSHRVNIGSIKINGPKTDVTIKPADATVKLGPIRGTGSASMDISSSLVIFSLRPRDKGKGQDKVYSALKEIKFSDSNHKKSTIHITTSTSFDSPIIAAKDTNGEIVIQADVKLKQPITTHNKDIDITIFKEPLAKETQLTLSADNALITPSMGNINFNFGDPRTILSINGKDTTITGNIANGNNGTLNVLATLTTTTPTITTIQNTNIENNVDFNIDSINSNIDLLGNSTQIIFKGENAELGLINTSNANDRQFSLYANLNPSNASDNYGIVRIGAFTNGLTIANKNGPFTIGQDNTHRLKEFIVHGRGNIIIDNMVFTKLLRMDSTSQVTFNQALDLGDGGNIVFRLDSTLVVNGVKGNIITSKNGRGTLTIHSGNVSGTIGDDKKSLKLINIGANPVKFSANVFSPVALTDNSSVLILADDVKLTGAVTTQNNMQGILSLGAGSSVTGQIGANDTVLDKVRVGAKASCLSGVVYAGAVELTDKTSVLMLQNDAVINGNITTSVGNTSGKLIFTKNGMVTGNVGVISEILFNGVDKIQGTANVTTFTVGDAAADATVTGLMTGDVVYTAAGELTAMNGLKGNVDFKNNAGTFVLGDGATITGVVTSTGGRAGTLNFAGNARVTKGIGTNADNSPALISVQGDGTASVALDDDIFVGGINFINGGKLGFNGNLTTPNIDFGVNGGTLEFRAGNPYTLSSTIANGGNGVLNVLTTVTATDPTIGTVKTINIGEVGTPQIFIIQVNNPNLAVNSNINLLNAGSQLTITVPQDQTITFVNSVKGVVGGGGGIINLNGNSKALTVDGNNGATLGSASNELATLNIMGKVTITNNLDVHNINQLNIKAGADFTDQSLTSAQITNIAIGEVAGAGTYTLDAVNGDFDLNTANMTFMNKDSVLNLSNSSDNDDHTINLTGPLDPGDEQFGIVQLSTGDKNLTIDNGGNAGYTLGTAAHNLKQLNFYSNGIGTINLNAGIEVESIVLNIPQIQLGVVNANVYFEDDTIYSATGNINGNTIDFQGNAGVINIADGVQINSAITSTGDTNGELNFAGTGEVTQLVTNIAMLQVGAGNVSLAAGGNYSIGEIRGNGNNNLTFGAK